MVGVGVDYFEGLDGSIVEESPWAGCVVLAVLVGW